MISLCVKINKILIFFIAVIVIFSIALLILCNIKQNRKIDPEEYLKSFGYEIELVSSKTVDIPKKFSKTLKQYNDLQKKQGFDLSRYSGKQCIQKQYYVKSDNCSNKDKFIANLITTNDGKLIGGDIHNETYGSKPMKLDSLQ